MKIAVALVVGAIGATTVSAAPSDGAMLPWDGEHPLSAGQTIGQFKIVGLRRSVASHDTEDAFVALALADGKGNRADLRVEIAFDDVSATYAFGRIDPESNKPQLFLTSYTGGAHCCTHIQLIEWGSNRWRVVNVGTFDGEPFRALPQDVDGDGVIDIVHADDRFAYAFEAYGGSWMPPRIFNVRAGEVSDVSSAPRYRKLFEADYREARKGCEEHSNGACAALVADGARVGRLAEAWKIADRYVDKGADWNLPGCKMTLKPRTACPDGQRYATVDFKVALTEFLAKAGYTAHR